MMFDASAGSGAKSIWFLEACSKRQELGCWLEQRLQLQWEHWSAQRRLAWRWSAASRRAVDADEHLGFVGCRLAELVGPSSNVQPKSLSLIDF